MPVRSSSAAMRSWKARLQILKRPNVWGAGMLLVVPLLFLADYWHDPSKVVAPGKSQTAPTDANALSGADAGQPSWLDSGVLNPLGGSAGKSSPSSAGQHPFVDPTLSKVPQINLFDSYSSGSTNSGLLGSSSIDPLASTQAGTGSSGQAATATGSTSLSPLQSALNHSAITTDTATAGTATAKPDGSTDPLSDSSTSSGATQTGDYHQSGLSSHAAGGSSQPSGYQPYVPQTSPTAGTTGYTVPPAFRTTTNTPSFGASPGYGTTSTGSASGSTGSSYGSAGYGSTDYGSTGSTGYGSAGSASGSNAPSYSSPSYTAPEPAPFSVPNTPPGRYTGGGQINTFSNP